MPGIWHLIRIEKRHERTDPRDGEDAERRDDHPRAAQGADQVVNSWVADGVPPWVLSNLLILATEEDRKALGLPSPIHR